MLNNSGVIFTPLISIKAKHHFFQFTKAHIGLA